MLCPVVDTGPDRLEGRARPPHRHQGQHKCAAPAGGEGHGQGGAECSVAAGGTDADGVRDERRRNFHPRYQQGGRIQRNRTPGAAVARSIAEQLSRPWCEKRGRYLEKRARRSKHSREQTTRRSLLSSCCRCFVGWVHMPIFLCGKRSLAKPGLGQTRHGKWIRVTLVGGFGSGSRCLSIPSPGATMVGISPAAPRMACSQSGTSDPFNLSKTP